jgi:uncharacterized membrane protein YdbT with pleckstrin-like domain
VPTIFEAPQPLPQKRSAKDRKPHRLDTIEIVKDALGKTTQNPLAAFAVLPKRVSFETQEVKETIVLLLRKHWATNVPWVAVAVALALAPLVLQTFPLLVFLPFRFQVVAIVMWYLFTLAFILESFLSWYFNVYLVTDERLVDVDFYSLIYKRISETKIDRIQDVSYSQGGIVESVFNYGTVTIQTAGEVPEFEFTSVPRPAQITKVLNQLTLQEEKEKLEGRVS